MANVLVGHRVVVSREVAVGESTSFSVEAGQLIQLIDLAGAQVAAFLAWTTGDAPERLSPTTTMTANASIVAKEGDTLFGNRKTAMFEIVSDVVGRHDLLTGPLPVPTPDSPAQSVQPTMLDPLTRAAEDAGIANPDVSAPVNFFKHVNIKAKGETEVKESLSERNDTLVLRVLADATVVVGNAFHERRPGLTAGKSAVEKEGDILVRVYSA